MAKPEPTILAFDTSAAHCAAALLMRGRIVAERFEEMKKGQAERLFPMLDEVLGEVGAVWEDLDAIGVGTGPGNFTGIRIAVSAARGLALSLGVPAIGVTSFELMRGDLEGHGPAEIVSLPGPQNQVYIQSFQKGTADAPRIVPIFAEALRGLPRKHPDARVIGYEASRIAFELTEFDSKRPDDPYHGSHGEDRSIGNWAATLAALAARRFVQTDRHPSPTPLYIRPPDAAPSSDPPPVILP